MSDKKTIEGAIPGERSKRYQLWRVNQTGELIERVAEADSREELDKVKRRDDWLYKIRGEPKK